MKLQKIWVTVISMIVIFSGLQILIIGSGSKPIHEEPSAGVGRVVLLEDFTGWDCEPCKVRNAALLDALYEYGYSQMAPLWYHPQTVDPFRIYNPEENTGRSSYYNISYVPWTIYDGFDHYDDSNPDNIRAKLDERLAFPANISITTIGNIDNINLNGTINAHIEAVEPIITTDLVVHFALWENNYTSGELEHHYNMRNMVGDPDTSDDSSGEPIFTGGVGAGTSVDLVRNFIIEEDWNIDELGMTIWIQSNSTKVVEQAHVEVFVHNPPDVTLITPNPLANNLIENGIIDIDWLATDPENHDLDPDLSVTIEYSPDGGNSWFEIMSGTNNNAPPYSWDTTSVPDGPNYMVRVQALCSLGKTGFAQSIQPLSIDNSPDDIWHFQVQASGPSMDLDMKPVEITPNIVQTSLLMGTGDFLIDRWETTKTFTGEVIDGDWTFDIYGYSTDPETMVGNLYAKVFASSNLGIPLDVTALDNENVGNFASSHLFTWTDTFAGVIPNGDSLVFEVWLNVGTGSGGDLTTTYDYTTGAGTTKSAYFGDLDAMPPDGGTIPDPFMNSKAECTDYPAIESSNDAYWTSGNPGLADETFVWSDIQVTDNPSWITQIDLTFEGMCNRAGNFQIWAFNQNTAVWEQIGTSEPYTASVEETVTRSITTDMVDYFLNGTLTWGVYEDAQMGVIDVDYLEVLVHYTVPYPLYSMEFDFGLAKSKVVTPFGLPLISHDIPIADPGGPWPAWRFLSFPISANGDVSSVLNDAFGDSGTTWDMVQWYDPTDTDDHWKTYNTYAPALSDMPTVNNRMGLWVHITANGGDGELTAGMGNYPGSTTIIQLYSGWNLVGYPSATPRIADTTLPIEVNKMAVYNSAQPYDFTDVTDLGTVLMQEDEAYWVYSTADVQWNVDP